MEYNDTIKKNILASRCTISNTKKNYLITDLNKLNCVKEKDKIICKIKEQFESVDNFFEIDDKIIIGKKLFNSTYREKFLTDVNERTRNLRTNTIKFVTSNTPHSANVLQKNVRRMKLTTNIHKDKRDNTLAISLRESQNDFKILDDKDINKIFEDAKFRSDKSKDKINEINKVIVEHKLMKSYDKRNFEKQENILYHNKRLNLRSANISKKICNQINKDEDDLLMNRAGDYRMKKQIKEILDNKTPFVEKFGERGWALNLRREKNPKKIRINYVNSGSNEKPIWEQMNEYPKKNIEVINSPRVNLNRDMKKFFKNNYLKGVCKFSKLNLDRLKLSNQIVIDGKNLLDEELKMAKEIVTEKKICKIRYQKEEEKDEIYKEYYNTNPKKQNYPKCLIKLKIRDRQVVEKNLNKI